VREGSKFVIDIVDVQRAPNRALGGIAQVRRLAAVLNRLDELPSLSNGPARPSELDVRGGLRRRPQGLGLDGVQVGVAGVLHLARDLERLEAAAPIGSGLLGGSQLKQVGPGGRSHPLVGALDVEIAGLCAGGGVLWFSG